MAILFDAPIEPDDLTVFVRDVPLPVDFRLYPDAARNEVQDNKVDWAEITRTNRTARFRAWDGRIHVSTRDTATEKTVALPPLSTSFNMGEYERLQLEFARNGGTREQALARAIYNDGERGTREIQARLEQAIGDLLDDGLLTINENGFASQYDGGVPANQKVNAATAWTDTTNATVLANLVTWRDVQIANGFRPERIRTSQAVVSLMQKNKEIIDAVHGAAAERTRVTLSDLNDLLSSESLPTIPVGADGQAVTYDNRVDVDGTSTRVLPADKVLLTPADLADLVVVNMGVTATALELVDSNESDMSFEDAPGIVGVIEKTGPPYRQFTFIDACGMPTLVDGIRLFIADIGTIS
jgi:hypothetical protein